MTDDLKQHEYWEREHGHRGYNHPVVRTFARQRIDYISSWCDLASLQNALDVGCGNGLSTFYMNEYIENIWAVDRSKRMLGQHPFRNMSKAILAEGHSLPFANDTIDLVYGWEILHHISDPSLVVSEMVRVSRLYVILAEPNPLNPAQFVFALLEHNHRWVLRYRLRFMCNLLESVGMKIKHISHGGTIFPNITPPWLANLLKHIPYRWPFGITNWVMGIKPDPP